MVETWYVPVTVEFNDALRSHIFVPGLPDDLMSTDDPDGGWSADEEEFGLFVVSFRKPATLTANQRRRMREMGCKPITETKPARPKSLQDRAEALRQTTQATMSK